MPRKSPGKRGETWDIKTQPELLHPILEAKHDEMAKSIKQAYYDIDKIYERVAEILDRHGVHTQARLLYRSYAERLWQINAKFSGKTAKNLANAMATLFNIYGCDEGILKEIALLFGFKVEVVVGVTKLSQLIIDVDKDWKGHVIKNLGAPVDPYDSLRKTDLDTHASNPDAHHAKLHASTHAVGGDDEIPDGALNRDKISDFFSSPFWDNIPDKPNLIKGPNGTKNIFVSSTTPAAEAIYDIWIQI